MLNMKKVSKSKKYMAVSMSGARPDGLFAWLNRAFWGVWLAFPVYLWIVVRDILGQARALTVLAPDQAACLAGLPLVTSFSLPGKLVFWAGFGLNFLLFALVLGLAHSVIRSCAQGRLFVAPLVRVLGWIALIITLFPVWDLGLSNLMAVALVATGDLPAFLPDLAFDVTVFGVGLLLLAIAAAMRQAMGLQRDAELTI